MSRKPWSKEARARHTARMRKGGDIYEKRIAKNLPAPVLAEPGSTSKVPLSAAYGGEARESTTTSSDIGRDSRGGQNPLEYLILRHGVDWVTLGADGWEYVGLDNQGNQVFKRKL